jgi:hypothetical protein
MGCFAWNPEHGGLNSPGQHNSVGHQFVAHRLPNSLHQVNELIFFAGVDRVFVPERKRLILCLLCGAGNTGQQDCNKTEQ